MLLSLLIIVIILSWYHRLFEPLPTDISDDDLPFISFIYSNILPTRAASRIIRPLTLKKIPKKLRKPIFQSVGKFYSVQWQEFKQDLTEYHTFHDFFTRRLEYQRCMCATDLISPVDGLVVACGKVDSQTQTLEQIKGVRFKLRQFLYGYEAQIASKMNFPGVHPGNALYYCILYLNPGDYHRFHSPANGIKFDCISHLVGDLYPVKPSWLKQVPGLFSLNERIVLSGKWRDDLFFAYIPVGAFNVGSIHLKDHPYHVTNQSIHDTDIWFKHTSNKSVDTFEKGQELIYDKGDEIGHFSFGSTVVLVFEAPNFNFHVCADTKIKFGDALGDML